MGVSVDNRVKTIWLMYSGEGKKAPTCCQIAFIDGYRKITKILQYCVGSDSAVMDKLRFFN